MSVCTSEKAFLPLHNNHWGVCVCTLHCISVCLCNWQLICADLLVLKIEEKVWLLFASWALHGKMKLGF